MPEVSTFSRTPLIHQLPGFSVAIIPVLLGISQSGKEGWTVTCRSSRDPGSPIGMTGLRGRLEITSPVQARRVGLQLPAMLPLSEWQHVGTQLALLWDSSAWWLADWLLYGEKAYPDRYRRAIDGTGLHYKTLRNYAWIGRRFPPSRRHPSLSFQHHAEVAALSEREQDLWLLRAETENWSRNALRKAVRSSARNASSRESEDTIAEVRFAVGKEKHARWELMAKHRGLTVNDWIVSTLDLASVGFLDEI